MTRLALVLSVFVVVSLGGCRGDDTPSSPSPADAATVEGFLLNLSHAISRDGHAYEVTIETVGIDPKGARTPMYTTKLWLDLPGDRWAAEIQKAPGWNADVADQVDYAGAGNDIYASNGSDDPSHYLATDRPGCLPRVVAVPVQTLVCGVLEAVDDSTVPSVREGEYEGRPARVLVFSKEMPADGPGGTDGTPPASPSGNALLEYRFYVDRDTFLPFALETVATQAGRSPGAVRGTIAGKFVPFRSLKSALFDPKSLGYVSPSETERALLDSFVAAGPFFWLARKFDPGSGLPPLAFREATSTSGIGRERQSIGFISYLSAASPLPIYVETWTPSGWTSYWDRVRGVTAWGSNCAKSETLDLPLGRATIWLGYRGDSMSDLGRVQPGTPPPPPTGTPTLFVFPTPTPRQCTNQPYDAVLGVLETGTRTVTINAPLALATPPGQKAGPFDTRAAMESLLRGLRPMAPGE